MDLFDESLVFLEMEVKDRDDLFDQISNVVESKSMVTDEFRIKIKERENNYPTGLQTESIGIAIPHTDPEHIIQPFVAVVRPTNPISFQRMGMGEGEIGAELVFVLGVKGDGAQVTMLSQLMEMMMDDFAVKELMSCSNNKDLLSIIKRKFEGE